MPIRVEFETDTHRIRDCFVWNLYEDLISPEAFARTFCSDLDLPVNPWAETVANQIRAQIEDHEGVAGMDFGLDTMDVYGPGEDEVPECRVILSVRSTSLIYAYMHFFLCSLYASRSRWSRPAVHHV